MGKKKRKSKNSLTMTAASAIAALQGAGSYKQLKKADDMNWKSLEYGKRVPIGDLIKTQWFYSEMEEIIKRMKCQGCNAPATPGGKGCCPYCGRRYGE